jgi:uncharacterized membrane protein YraQ (UPF0718 family)
MARAATRTRSDPSMIVLLIAILALAAVALRTLDIGRVASLQNFLLIFSSLLVEAVPFVLIGATVSAAIEIYVPSRVFESLSRLPGPFQLPAAGLAGMAFPVCECGSVPVARRMVSKGLSPAAGVTFMLSAPILNPVVLISTYVAYRGRDELWPMVVGRGALGLLAAMAVGWVIAKQSPEELLRPRAEEHHEHDLHGSRTSGFFGHLAGDFFFMGRYLVIGAVVAAALQTFVPSSFIGSVADTPVVALMAMMLLAYLLSLCSESDAFVAASFVQFGVGAQMAFLVFGPMVDTKLSFLYRGTYTKGFLRTVVIVVGVVTLAGTLWMEVLFG